MSKDSLHADSPNASELHKRAMSTDLLQPNCGTSALRLGAQAGILGVQGHLGGFGRLDVLDDALHQVLALQRHMTRGSGVNDLVCERWEYRRESMKNRPVWSTPGVIVKEGPAFSPHLFVGRPDNVPLHLHLRLAGAHGQDEVAQALHRHA